MAQMPLFCWKIFVNCDNSPNHTCCPKRKPRDKRSLPRTGRDIDPQFGIQIISQPQKQQNFDPQFGIPIVAQPQRRQDFVQRWKPYSPYYIGMKGFQKPNGKFKLLNNY